MAALKPNAATTVGAALHRVIALLLAALATAVARAGPAKNQRHGGDFGPHAVVRGAGGRTDATDRYDAQGRVAGAPDAAGRGCLNWRRGNISHSLKMLAAPLILVTAFVLVGAPSAPATALLSGSGLACADNGGLCYGGYGPGACCPGYYYDSSAHYCLPEHCEAIRSQVAALYNTALTLAAIGAVTTLWMPGLGTITILASLGTGAIGYYITYDSPECF